MSCDVLGLRTGSLKIHKFRVKTPISHPSVQLAEYSIHLAGPAVSQAESLLLQMTTCDFLPPPATPISGSCCHYFCQGVQTLAHNEP